MLLKYTLNEDMTGLYQFSHQHRITGDVVVQGSQLLLSEAREHVPYRNVRLPFLVGQICILQLTQAPRIIVDLGVHRHQKPCHLLLPLACKVM